MRYDVAGTTVELGHTVWLFETGSGAPIFHATEMRKLDRPERLFAHVTRCGLHVQSEHRGGYADAMHLPPKHAVKFGRPCVRCWPELQRQEPLFSNQRRRRRDRATQEAMTL